MKSFLRTILRILDGSPTTSMATKNRQRGQSMLELALLTPLLAILVAGAVEVGWYTNHWLSLLEVTRVGARSATFFTDNLSPLEWNDNGSIVPDIQTELMNISGTHPTVLRARNVRDCETGAGSGFYSAVTCLVEQGLDPLEFYIDPYDRLDADSEAQEEQESRSRKHPDNIQCEEDAAADGPGGLEVVDCYDSSLDNPNQDLQSHDDVVVSVFAIQTVNNAREGAPEPNNDGVAGGRPTYTDYSLLGETIDPASSTYKETYDLNSAITNNEDYPPGRQSIVVGRFPANANECTQKGTDSSNDQLMDPTDPGYEVDPFDYLDADDSASSGLPTVRLWAGEPYTLELTDAEGNAYADDNPEYQRGYSFTGQHRVSDPNLFCYGSEFSVDDIERLINMPGFIEPDLYDAPDSVSEPLAYDAWVQAVYDSQDEREFFAPQGMTLVEVFWEHDMLLNFGFFRPLKEAYGDGDIVIALWSAFPLPSAAPNILYQLP